MAISTDSIDQRNRFDFWREVVCRHYGEMEARPLAAVERFHASVIQTTVGAVQLTRASSGPTPHLGTRTPALIAGADEHYFMIGLILDGSCVLVQDEREGVLARPGDFAMYDTTRPYKLGIDGKIGLLTLRIPQTLMQAVLPKAYAATATPVNGQAGTAALVRPLLDNLIRTADSVSPITQRHRTMAAVELPAGALP